MKPTFNSKYQKHINDLKRATKAITNVPKSNSKQRKPSKNTQEKHKKIKRDQICPKI